jgi:glycosyltransferase involved in cell wall biosynthesis
LLAHDDVNKKTMKLAVDTHHLVLEHAGTKRVTENLLSQFRNTAGLDLVIFTPPYPLKRGNSFLAKAAGHLIRFFWVHLHLPYLCFKNKADVLLSPEFNTPLYTPCKRAVIAHDAHMRAQRDFTSPLWFYFYYIPFIELAIRHADLIFTVSHFAKKQIVQLMRLDERKVKVCYNGIDKSFLANNLPANGFPETVGLKSGGYILFVGTYESRKNVERLIRAFARVKQRNPRAAEIKLAIAGNAGTSKFSDRSKQIQHLIEELNLQDQIILCGYVPDEQLPSLYRGAAMIAFPSLHEGFGLPIIEGFASGVPVLTSNLCSMPEIAGGAAMIADPYNIPELAEKIEQLIFDPQVRQRLISDGRRRVNDFTWEQCADQMVQSLKTLF